MKLYYHPLSGHSHRVHLFLSLLSLDYDLIEVDLAKAAHKSADFRKLNSFGQVPVLDDNGTVLADSNAILVYLAKKFGDLNWLPETPAGASAVQRWLSVAAGEIAHGPARARLITVFGAPYNAEDTIAAAHRVLSAIDAELDGREWIAALHPTIADVALYSYIAKAPEGNVDIGGYSNLTQWLKRIEGLKGFVPFVDTPVGLAAKA